MHKRVGIDVIETYNGRSFRRKYGHAATQWAKANLVATASGSDAHGPWGWGRTYTILEDIPARETFIELLVGASKDKRVGIGGRMHPKLNVGIKALQHALAT